MSEAQGITLVESLKQKHAQFVAQRDQAQANFQQIVGAIFACECLLKAHEEELKSKESNQGEDNGEAHEQTEEQAA